MNAILPGLPGAIAERIRLLNDEPVRGGAEFVLHWMHHAVRGHDNPALDTAILLANQRHLPVLVYQGLGGRHRFNSDRHHTFIMEGARDAARELHDRGVRHAFFLPSAPDQPSPLPDLARRAAIVITEDFPLPPFPRWSQRLADRCGCAVLAVDATCIVPMQSVPTRHDRAFRYREATQDEYDRRVPRGWDLEPPIQTAPPLGDAALGFEPVDLDREDIADLVARCDIDHSIGPVAHTRGGSVAADRRWRDFLDIGLRSYASRRNDAARGGVSRLSPYLHHGHISPFRIARDAREQGGQGADRGAVKFLDELLIWRELSHNFCFHTPPEQLETLDAIPDWARQTLESHASDVRPATYSWETLARARTDDPLWNAAQRSLIIHGELHNNVRMTWGKAILKWTESPSRALRMMIDLNHRFALDGNDPNSYGGLLWCLGQFDRPFKPARPILGTVRARETSDHADRLDLRAYERKVAGPASGKALRVGVIGAGVSGLTCARILQDHGHDVEVFDKGRGPGGRMSTRRDGDRRFDHGAQYFTARHPVFRRHVLSWVRDGAAARWDVPPATVRAGVVDWQFDDSDRFVGAPAMNAIARHLGTDLEVRFGERIDAVQRIAAGWRAEMSATRDARECEILIVATPPAQAAALLAEAAPDVSEAVGAVTMDPCWAVMVEFASAPQVEFDAAFIKDSPLSWAARDGAKPERGDGQTWVLHGSPEWSRAHLKDDAGAVGPALVEAFGAAAGVALPEVVHLATHRWRYAQPRGSLGDDCVFDAGLGVGVCGDWCLGGRVEGAFLSGAALAGRVLAHAASSAATETHFESQV